MSIVRTCSPIIARMDSHSSSYASIHRHQNSQTYLHPVPSPFLSPSPSSSSHHRQSPFEDNDHDEHHRTLTDSISSLSSSNGRGSDTLSELPPSSPSSSMTLSAKAKRRCVRRSAVSSASVIDADDPDFSMIRQLSFHAVNDLYTKTERIQKLQAYLIHHPLIASLPSDNQQRVYSEMMIEELPHNSIIARKGEIIQKFYVIDDGEIAVYQQPIDHSNDAIKEHKNSECEESGMKGIVSTSSPKLNHPSLYSNSISSPSSSPSSTLKSGDTIGDLALVHASSSQYTYRVSSSRARVFSIDVASFRFLVSSSNRQKYETLKEFFQSSSLFTFSSTLDSSELDALIDGSDLKQMKKGESIVTRTASNAPPPSPTRLRSPDELSPPSSPSNNATDDDKKEKESSDPFMVYVVKKGRLRLRCKPSCACHATKPATLGSVIALMKGGEEEKCDDNDMNVSLAPEQEEQNQENLVSMLSSAMGRTTVVEADGLFGALPLHDNQKPSQTDVLSLSPSLRSAANSTASNSQFCYPSPSTLYHTLPSSAPSIAQPGSRVSSPPRSPTLSHQHSYDKPSSSSSSSSLYPQSSCYQTFSSNVLSILSFNNPSPLSSCPNTPSTEKRGLKRNRLDGANNISAINALAATVSSPVRPPSSLLTQPHRPRYHACHRATCDTDGALIITIDLASIEPSIVEKLKRVLI